jgi:HPr kinase/phosphorylase
MSEPEYSVLPRMSVRELLGEDASSLGLRLRAGRRGLDRVITAQRLQKPGLALAGFMEIVHPGRVQVLGQSEIDFLDRTPGETRARVIEQLCEHEIACFVVSKGLATPPELHGACDRAGIPLLVTGLVSSVLIDRLTRFLERRLAPQLRLHGVLIDVYGLGVLLLGESGVGKSECALDLIVRGHRLVSDDVVEIRRVGDVLAGTGPELTRYHMELRGLGILNVKDLFGVASVRRTKDIELVLRLAHWEEGETYERLGLDERTYEILGVATPLIEMPVAPGRNLAMLIEVAARNHLLKQKGYHPARELAARLDEKLRRDEPPDSAPAAGEAAGKDETCPPSS